jgi:hypothetical protein
MYESTNNIMNMPKSVSPSDCNEILWVKLCKNNTLCLFSGVNLYYDLQYKVVASNAVLIHIHYDACLDLTSLPKVYISIRHCQFFCFPIQPLFHLIASEFVTFWRLRQLDEQYYSEFILNSRSIQQAEIFS